MQKTTIISMIFGIVVAVSFAAVLGCIGEINATWCGILTVAQDKYGKIITPVTNTVGNIDSEDKEKPNIVVDSPKPNEEVGLPLVVKGEARVFENAFNFRVKDENGTVIYEGFDTALARDSGLFGPFELNLNYPKPKSSKGTLEVFSYSAKDGLEINMVVVPIRFKEVDSRTIKIFLNKEGQSKCEETVSLSRRIPREAPPGLTALQELLKGPTPEEFRQGVRTSIDTGVQIKSLVIENGVARADFSRLLQTGVRGSCRVAAIRAQIEDTLKQFSTVQSVVISIDGKTENILQP